MAFSRSSRLLCIALILAVTVVGLVCFSGPLLGAVGNFLITDDSPVLSDAIVVLFTGVDYYPRLIEAARLYKEGIAPKIVIDGDRKTDALRGLEKRGFHPCCPWYEDSLRVLTLLGVPRGDVMPIAAPDAYDTVSEAKAVGSELVSSGFKRIILTTSKFHSRRAHFIWSRMYEDKLAVISVAAKSDPFDAGGWWKSGRQIRWVLSEYGAWVYYGWKTMTGMSHNRQPDMSAG